MRPPLFEAEGVSKQAAEVDPPALSQVEVMYPPAELGVS